MPYVFTNTNGFLKIVNSLLGYEASTDNLVNLSTRVNPTTGNTTIIAITSREFTVGNQVLPRVWRVRTVIGGTIPAVTATIGASVIV